MAFDIPGYAQTVLFFALCPEHAQECASEFQAVCRGWNAEPLDLEFHTWDEEDTPAVRRQLGFTD